MQLRKTTASVRKPALAIAAALLAGCGGGSPSTKPSSKPTPEPTTYTAAQLAAALPRAGTELRGVKLRSECRDLTKPCPSSSEDGWAFVDATTDPQSVQIHVQVWQTWDSGRWKDFVSACPQGEYEKPLVEQDESAYTPGERGTSRRTKWTVGTWTGFTCQKDIVLLWPEGKRSDPTQMQYVFLNNGHHMLRAGGRSLSEAKELATEYLDRLSGEAG